jgi:hypothetical protein
MSNLSSISTNTLYAYMRNALNTATTCTGHTKAHWCFVHANRYRDELNNRGEQLPDYDLSRLFVEDEGWRSQQVEMGEFNGDGSSGVF